MRLTKEHIDYIIAAKASFETPKVIYAYLTSQTYVDVHGGIKLDMTFDTFFHTCSNHMRSKQPDGWPARIAEERRLRNEAIMEKVQYATLFERIKKLNDIASSSMSNNATRIAALKAIHDMLNEEGRNAAVKQSGTSTITISSDRLDTARRFLT
jgi:hypothetical protein